MLVWCHFFFLLFSSLFLGFLYYNLYIFVLSYLQFTSGSTISYEYVFVFFFSIFNILFVATSGTAGLHLTVCLSLYFYLWQPDLQCLRRPRHEERYWVAWPNQTSKVFWESLDSTCLWRYLSCTCTLNACWCASALSKRKCLSTSIMLQVFTVWLASTPSSCHTGRRWGCQRV